MYFMYHGTTAPTGRILARALNAPHGTAAPSNREDVIIRWGTYGRTPYRPSSVLNGREAVRRASDKFGSLQFMQARGVPVPRFSYDPRGLRSPFLGRLTQHTRGEDIVLCMQLMDAFRSESEYFIEYVPVAREYRVHVFGDEVIKQSEKVLTDAAAYTPWIRNHEHGHTFRHPSVRLNHFQEAIAISAVQSLRLDFGAVDLIVNDEGQSYVLEVNTAPSCSPTTGKAYIEAIKNHLEVLGVETSFNYDVLNELSNTLEEDISNDDSFTEEVEGTYVPF